jgi:hypothetical protein
MKEPLQAESTNLFLVGSSQAEQIANRGAHSNSDTHFCSNQVCNFQFSWDKSRHVNNSKSGLKLPTSNWDNFEIAMGLFPRTNFHSISGASKLEGFTQQQQKSKRFQVKFNQD